MKIILHEFKLNLLVSVKMGRVQLVRMGIFVLSCAPHASSTGLVYKSPFVWGKN